jgi:hypothetical protein
MASSISKNNKGTQTHVEKMRLKMFFETAIVRIPYLSKGKMLAV